MFHGDIESKNALSSPGNVCAHHIRFAAKTGPRQTHHQNTADKELTHHP
jgi:hypothetical protein